MTFIKQLKAINGVTDIEIERDRSYFIEFYLSHPSLKEEICFTFDDFDAKDKKDQEKILKSVQYLISNFSNIMAQSNEKLALYMTKEYEDKIDTPPNLIIDKYDTYSTGIYFSHKYEFGTCCISFNSALEEEHGFGVGLVDWKVHKIGFGDICFSNFYK